MTIMRALVESCPRSKTPSWPRLGSQPAVDHEDLAGHERGFVRGEIECQPTDIVGLAEPADRLLAQELLTPGFVLPEVRAEVGLDQARSRAFTRMPCWPNSRAQHRVIMIRPAFVKL